MRRDWLRNVLSGLAYAVLPSTKPKVECGACEPSTFMRQRFLALPSFYQVFSCFRGISQGEGKNVFLYQNLLKQLGTIEPHWQGPDPETGNEGEGDCVGHASAMGIDVLTATEIHQFGEPEKWEAKCSVEMNYAGSRVEIGGGTIRGRGGSHGEWAARWLKEYGVLHRVEYRDGLNFLDLTGYDPGRSRQFRDKGVPDWLEPIARKHPIRAYTNPRSGMEALDAVCAGMPVLVCSSYAFRDKRDAQGFCKPYLGRGRQTWYHAMVLTGAVMEGGRVGGTIQNSHGIWNSGPRPNDMPEGSFNVDVEYLDLMIQDWYDCWAFSAYTGHEALKRRHRLYKR